MQLPSAASRLNSTTRQSSCTPSTFGGSLGTLCMLSSRMPPYAINSPTAAPAIESMRLSVISWRTTRLRPAPMDRRIAISRLRARARASNRFATFEHAMIRISATSPISILASASNCGLCCMRLCEFRADRHVPVAIRLRILALERGPDRGKFSLRRCL